MSTLEDREWDAERDARTGCDECGLTLARCDCVEPDPMPDPDDLTPADAACWAAMCTAVARAVRHELPYATAERVAQELEHIEQTESASSVSPAHVDAVARCMEQGHHPYGVGTPESDARARLLLTSINPDVHAALLESVLRTADGRALALGALARHGVLVEERKTLDDGMAGTVWQPDGTNRHIFRAPTVKRRLVTGWEPTT